MVLSKMIRSNPPRKARSSLRVPSLTPDLTDQDQDQGTPEVLSPILSHSTSLPRITMSHSSTPSLTGNSHTSFSPHKLDKGSSHRGKHLVRGAQLRRNEACSACRRRRTKCDAAKPHCGACVRHHRHLKRQKEVEGEDEDCGCVYDKTGKGRSDSGSESKSVSSMEEKIPKPSPIRAIKKRLVRPARAVSLSMAMESRRANRLEGSSRPATALGGVQGGERWGWGGLMDDRACQSQATTPWLNSSTFPTPAPNTLPPPTSHPDPNTFPIYSYGDQQPYLTQYTPVPSPFPEQHHHPHLMSRSQTLPTHLHQAWTSRDSHDHGLIYPSANIWDQQSQAQPGYTAYQPSSSRLTPNQPNLMLRRPSPFAFNHPSDQSYWPTTTPWQHVTATHPPLRTSTHQPTNQPENSNLTTVHNQAFSGSGYHPSPYPTQSNINTHTLQDTARWAEHQGSYRAHQMQGSGGNEVTGHGMAAGPFTPEQLYMVMQNLAGGGGRQPGQGQG